MRTRAWPLLFLALGALPLAAAPATPWEKAVALAGRVADRLPARAAFVLELVDATGAAQETWTAEYRLAPVADGTVAVEVVSATHNGTDTTALEKENQKKRPRNPFRWDNPFDPAVQGSVTAVARPAPESLEGRACVVYDFALKKKDGSTVSGTAWLDAASGAPVQVRSTTKPLPRAIFEMSTTLRYGPGGDALLAAARVEGVGGLLFIRRSFRSTVTIEEWGPASAAAPTP